MSIHHPYQDQRVKVAQGQHAGRTAKVLRVLPDHGTHGFAELEFDPPKGSRKKDKERDLVNVLFLDHAGVQHADPA